MGRKLHYKMGSFYRVCDRTGFTERAEDTKREWTGMIVSERVWEERQPQDFVRGVADNQTVPSPRPEGPDVFSGPISIPMSAAAAPQATFIALEYITGVSATDRIGVMLDNGVAFRTTVLSVIPTGVNLVSGIPSGASAGNLLIDYDA